VVGLVGGFGEDGSLYINRHGKPVTQECPHSAFTANCSDVCPRMGEPQEIEETMDLLPGSPKIKRVSLATCDRFLFFEQFKDERE